MKAKRRVVTHPDRKGTKRTPTVRRIKSAIVPAPKPAGRPMVAAVSGAAPAAGPATPPRATRPAALDEDLPGAPSPVDLTVDLAPTRGGLCLANPVLVASGTFGYGVEYGDVVDVGRLGAICCKGTTLKPRIGNIPPRVTETPGGMLNSIGLQNPGVDAVIE